MNYPIKIYHLLRTHKHNQSFSRGTIPGHIPRLQVCGGEHNNGPQRGHLAGGDRQADPAPAGGGQEQQVLHKVWILVDI
jgi:hypothetical protein